MRTGAGWVTIFLGLGFGIPCAVGLRHFAEFGEVWTFLGFPTYGGGPFERVDLPTSTPLLVAFFAVCMAQVVVGGLLIAGVSWAPVVFWVLLSLSLVCWIGFSLPFGPVLGTLAAVLLLLSS